MAENQNVSLEITPNVFHYFKYTLKTKGDVKRNFSIYKHIFSKRRYNFLEHN